MIDFQKAKINTAGVYVRINGFYVFAVGIRPYHGNIPVVRLGGHREANETGWQCAVREVAEEAGIKISPCSPATTYFVDWDHTEAELQEIHWQCESEGEPNPMLVAAYERAAETHLSLMYLADADRLPIPSSEVKGLLLLTVAEIHRLCREQITLESYLMAGGKALLKAEFDTKRILEPFAQLRLLSRILSTRPESAIT